MGDMATIVILTDEFDAIANDTNFGKKLTDAIQKQSTSLKNVPLDGYSSFVANVAPSDDAVFMVVGGNKAAIIEHRIGHHKYRI